MQKVAINLDEMRKLSSQMQEISEEMHTRTDNIIWISGLSTEEQLMIKDVKDEYMSSFLNLDFETYKRYSKIENTYSELKYFYSSEAKMLKALAKLGHSSHNQPQYDYNLTLEEAVSVYLGCTLEEAEAVSINIKLADKYYQSYVMELRGNYKGDLGALVGKNTADYEQDARALEQSMKSHASELKEKITSDDMKERMTKFAQAMETAMQAFSSNTNKNPNQELEQMMKETEVTDQNASNKRM